MLFCWFAFNTLCLPLEDGVIILGKNPAEGINTKEMVSDEGCDCYLSVVRNLREIKCQKQFYNLTVAASFGIFSLRIDFKAKK